MPPDRESGFPTGIRPDSNRENLKCGPPAKTVRCANVSIVGCPRHAKVVVCLSIGFALCYAIVLPGRKSGFWVGFRPDTDQESLTIGPPAGRRPNFEVLPTKKNIRNLARKHDFRAGGSIAQHTVGSVFLWRVIENTLVNRLSVLAMLRGLVLAGLHPMLRNNASGPEITLAGPDFGRILIGKAS